MVIAESYRFVLADLQQKKKSLEEELLFLNRVIPVFEDVCGVKVEADIDTSQIPFVTSAISLRWAILWFLAMNGRATTGQLKTVILEGGYRTTRASTFGNAVSANLSGMLRRNEVEKTEGGHYQLTPYGVSNWNFFKRTRLFQKIQQVIEHGPSEEGVKE